MNLGRAGDDFAKAKVGTYLPIAVSSHRYVPDQSELEMTVTRVPK